MNVYSLGPATQYPLLTAETAPFAVDAILLLQPEEELAETEANLLALYRRYGRPIITDPDAAATLPRTNYQPINCGYYDHFEAAIVQRRAVELQYLLTNGTPTTKTTRLRDLKTAQTEEFVQLASGEWLRLDRIVSLDGEAAGASCSF